MDYKYIEQLLQRYWECQTTLEEEQILRTFFSQKDVPAQLLPYGYIFQAEQQMLTEDRLDDDFDQQVLSRIQSQTNAVKARPFTWSLRTSPLYKAAAVIAVVVCLSTAIQSGWNHTAVTQQPQDVALQPGDSTSLEDIVPLPTAATSITTADTLCHMPVSN